MRRNFTELAAPVNASPERRARVEAWKASMEKLAELVQTSQEEVTRMAKKVQELAQQNEIHLRCMNCEAVSREPAGTRLLACPLCGGTLPKLRTMQAWCPVCKKEQLVWFGERTGWQLHCGHIVSTEHLTCWKPSALGK